MINKARLITLISVIVAAGASLYLLGCEADTTGPTPPEVDYLPQTFSLAVADGSASNDGFAHNGVAVIKLDWNNPTPGANAVAPKYVYEYANQPYPRLDGSLINDAATWAQAPETVLTLNNVYGNGGVTTLRVKSVYTFVNPPRIWFLLRWDDTADDPPHNSGYWGNHWEVVSKTGGGRDWWDRIFADNEDWVAFMWDTWHQDYPDGYWNYPNPEDPKHYLHDTPKNPANWVFVGKGQGFQANGCTVTCHEGDANHPHAMINTTYDYDHHWAAPGVDPGYLDVWMWTGTRTNYTATLANWRSGANEPAFLFDCVLNQTGFGWGTNDAYTTEEWLTFDEGTAPYFINDNGTNGYPDYGDFNDPGANAKYLWFAVGAVREFGAVGEEVISPTDPLWNIDDRVAGYLHRNALGGCSDVVGHGGWEDGEWTLEVRRNIGATYEDIASEEDVFLGIFEAHPDE
jgi:hypothetical protein